MRKLIFNLRLCCDSAVARTAARTVTRTDGTIRRGAHRAPTNGAIRRGAHRGAHRARTDGQSDVARTVARTDGPIRRGAHRDAHRARIDGAVGHGAQRARTRELLFLWRREQTEG